MGDVVSVPGRGVPRKPGNAAQWVDLPPDMPWARVGSWRDSEGTPYVVLGVTEGDLRRDIPEAEIIMPIEQAQALARGLVEAVAHAGGY